MSRAVSRKDFLRLGSMGLTGVALFGAAGCGGSLGGNKDVVRFLTGTEETTTQERAVTDPQSFVTEMGVITDVPTTRSA